MLSPVPCWSSMERVSLRKPFGKKKYESSTGSSEESNYLTPHRPPLKTTNHICLPSAVINGDNGEKNPITSGKDDCKNKYDDLDEMFNAVPRKTLLSDIDNKKHIDKFFSQFDDPYAKLPIPKTPRPPPSPDALLLSPKTPIDNLTSYVPNEIRLAREKALEEGHNEFRLILKKSGVDPDEHFSKIFSSKKKSSRKVNFECSTPKPDYSNISAYNTPIVHYSQVDTPISGVKQLSEGNRSILSPFNLNLTLSPLPSCRSDVSYNETSSPLKIPPEIKSTILSGIVCYVDVRSENENKLESVKAELLSLGASVEKNFTKKVTHVVFKEGRISTYSKAKKEGIPIVGILWIEACKMVRGIADPAMHRPSRMDKYDDLMPYQLIKKRRLGLLNPNSRVRKNLMMVCDEIPLTPINDRKTRSRKAITETKYASKRLKGKTSEEQKFGKKLLFDKYSDNDNYLGDKENVDTNVHHLSNSSTDNSAEIKLAAAKKRKSAPGKLLSKKNARREDIKAYLHKLHKGNEAEQEMISIDKEVEELKKQRNKEPEPSQAPEKKRRKLFNPSEVFIHSQVTDGSGELPEEISPLSKEQENIPPTPKRARTKATQPNKSLKVSLARKLHQRKIEAVDDGSSPSGLLFVERYPGSIRKKKQQPPSITLTSIPRDQMPNYIKMIEELGRFKVVDKVTKTTTHVVSNGPRRTLNIIKGIARGCWIIDLKWLTKSNTCGRWLPEEDFDLSSHFPAAVECCKERRGLKSTRVIDVFKGSGQIYVSRKSVPPYKDLEELLRLCSANLTSDPEAADIQVGKSETSTSATVVSEKWVLDSITRNTLLPLEDFIED